MIEKKIKIYKNGREIVQTDDFSLPILPNITRRGNMLDMNIAKGALLLQNVRCVMMN